jgi:hypothetical protein
MFFEQFMAYSLAMQKLRTEISTRMTGGVLYHLNQSLVRLRDRLQTDTSDALVMTIIVLAETFLTCGEYKAAGIHI